MPSPSLLIPGSSVDLGMCSFRAPWSSCHFCHEMKKVNVLPVSHKFPCCYAAGLSSSFKDTSSPTGGPIVVIAKLKRE